MAAIYAKLNRSVYYVRRILHFFYRELTVLKVPFIYFPIEGHPEQPTFVSHALANYQAGYKMIYAETSSESLAEAILSRISKQVAYKKVDADGARKAAQYLYSFLKR